MKGRHHKSFHLPESTPHFPPSKDFHTSHIKIELSLDFAMKSMSGSCTIDLEPVRGELNRISLDACDMNIEKAEFDGTSSPFEHDGKVLTILPGSPVTGKHSVRVSYSATPKRGVHFVGPDPQNPDREVQAWTHGEPDSSRYWFPCRDFPDDKSTSELILTVPREFTVVSNGKLLSTREEGEKAVFHWKEEAPHSTYLTSFVAGRFEEMTQESRGVKLHYHFPTRKKADVLRYFGETPRMIEIFEDLTGVKYPYAKYSQTTVENFLWGGEENLNATTLAMTYYPDAASEEDFQTSYSASSYTAFNLVAHELAHQWFGDLVTCADWPHAWLNEAFASYFQALYLEKSRGVDEMRWDMGARAELYFEEDEKVYRRAIVDRNYFLPDDLFDYATYEKGSSMLHQLRFYMGDAAFFAGVSEYLKAYSYSVADSHDFLRVMEKNSGMALLELFEQSFYKPGHPEFEVEYTFDASGKTASLHVNQVQNTEDGTPVFKLPCEVVFSVGGKTRSYKVWITSADQTMTFELGDKPSIVEFDPQRWLLARITFPKTLELLLNQLAGSREAWSRAEAARDLGKMKSDAAIPGLRAAAETEQFWHVRACALRALGEIGTPAALDALLKTGLPKDRKVRRALAGSLGNFKGEGPRDALLGLLKTDESPYVRCEAALSLTKCWPEGALPHLKEAMAVHSPNETLAEACLEAMGRVKGDEVGRIIMDSLPYGKPTRVRIGALKAIEQRGKIEGDEFPVLRDILRNDPEFRVKGYLVSYLIGPFADARFLDALKEASEVDSDARVRRSALAAFHELADGQEVLNSISKLKADVEKLQEENRGLSATRS